VRITAYSVFSLSPYPGSLSVCSALSFIFVFAFAAALEPLEIIVAGHFLLGHGQALRPLLGLALRQALSFGRGGRCVAARRSCGVDLKKGHSAHQLLGLAGELLGGRRHFF